ncbi:CMRF35-like molecule 5 isoform X2 [Melanerpes formicivorus]|uniref:CMRF35-like molecule 5 isoform X2 n=1 Tax=Melanerpes formicivorus TaxID=211600 RepID=UPI00358E80AE
MEEKLLIWTWILLPGCGALRGPAEVSGFPGGAVEVPCEYEPELVGANKYWCRGRSRIFCSILLQTTAPGAAASAERVSLRDDPARRVFVVTIEDLRAEDEDWYWCGIQVDGRDPMCPVMVSVLPVPSTTHSDLHTTQRQEATSTDMPKVRSQQAGTPKRLVLILTLSAALLLGIIICCRMRRASLEKSRAQAVEMKRNKDLQVTASWERAATSHNIYMNTQWELSSPEDDYENSPAKWQGSGKGAVVGCRAAELQAVYMNVR